MGGGGGIGGCFVGRGTPMQTFGQSVATTLQLIVDIFLFVTF